MDWATLLTVVTAFAGVALGAHLNDLNDRRRNRRRYQERSEEAARLLLDLCYQTYQHAQAYARLHATIPRAARTVPDQAEDHDWRDHVAARRVEEEPARRDRDVAVRQILALLHDVRDEQVRDVVRRFVTCIQAGPSAPELREFGKSFDQVWTQALEAAVATLGAYRRGQPLPDVAQLQDLSGRIQEYEEYREVLSGMLAEPEKRLEPPHT